MKDPRRLLEDATLTDVERRALLAARAAGPSPAVVDELWTKLAATTGATAAATGAATSAHHGAALAHAGASGKLAVLKALVLGAAVGTVTTGSVVTVSHVVSTGHRETSGVAAEPRGASRARAGSQPAEVAAPAIPPASATAPDPRLPSEPQPVISVKPASQAPAPQPGPSASSNAVAAFQAGAASAEPPGSLAGKDEARLVGMAREMLAQGDPTSAMVTLNEAARRYPHGILQQEREALTISALAQTGKTAEAAARARAFLRAFRDSPHAARVQRALGP
jgi:hypothetical protein